MIRALWTSATGMQAQQTNIDVIANNLSNVNTTGFKRSRADFQDLLYQTMRAPGTDTSQAGTQVPSGIQLGHGTRVSSVSKMFTQGDYVHTGNELDMAIEGQGFFQVQMPDGSTAYTRDGAFKRDVNGTVVTPDGYPLVPNFTIPPDTTTITVGPDGTFSVIQSGNPNPTQLGTIQLAQFVNPAGLSAAGRNLYTETAASGNAIPGTPGTDGLGTVQQTFLEMSNVNMVEEMINMITTQRAYEINSKTIQTADDMLGQVANLKR
ncbi:MAG: flagellar basal-body rod protein FlgG [Magnetococcales bacterium]|nr:flagellar basal-body rod protein FlgG [Magnetococcales bacterium]NGZ25281.1 flagellar basal-body rod protein FlgG [Magnetococcales bacterium]